MSTERAERLRERAAYLLRRSFDKGDEVVRLDADDYAVTSSTTEGGWYRVKTKGGCECEGYRRHRECRHFVRVAWEAKGQPIVEGIEETGWFPGHRLWAVA